MGIKDGFTYWYSYYSTWKKLSSKRQGIFTKNINLYAFEDKEPTGDNIDLALFDGIRPYLDKSRKNSANGASKDGNETGTNPKPIEIDTITIVEQNTPHLSSSYTTFSIDTPIEKSSLSINSVMDLDELTDDSIKYLESHILPEDFTEVIEKVDKRWRKEGFTKLKNPVAYIEATAKQMDVWRETLPLC